jgi:hypothetical protein
MPLDNIYSTDFAYDHLLNRQNTFIVKATYKDARLHTLELHPKQTNFYIISQFPFTSAQSKYRGPKCTPRSPIKSAI